MAVRSALKGLLVAVLALLLPACSIFISPDEEPAPVEGRTDPAVTVPEPGDPPGPPDQPSEPASSAAYGPLLDRAEAAAARGDYEQALALLERAQRIDPDSAEVYLAMARTHRATGDHDRARATAERGLFYCARSAQCEALRDYTR